MPSFTFAKANDPYLTYCKCKQRESARSSVEYKLSRESNFQKFSKGVRFFQAFEVRINSRYSKSGNPSPRDFISQNKKNTKNEAQRKSIHLEQLASSHNSRIKDRCENANRNPFPFTIN